VTDSRQRPGCGRTWSISRLRAASTRPRGRLTNLNCQRRERDGAVSDLERTCEIVDGMLKECEAADPAGAAAEPRTRRRLSPAGSPWG